MSLESQLEGEDSEVQYTYSNFFTVKTGHYYEFESDE